LTLYLVGLLEGHPACKNLAKAIARYSYEKDIQGARPKLE